MNRSGIDANRREIAVAACELVAEGGLDSMSMRRIAKRLDLTTGYVTHYFAEKEDLLEAALLAALDELTTRLARQPEALDEWLDIVVGTLPHTGESPRFWRVLTAFQAASLNSLRLSAVLREYAPDREAALARLLEGLVPLDSPQPEVNALARSILTLLAGLGTTSTITPGAFSRAQQRALVRASVYGLIDEFNTRRSSGPAD